MAGELKILNEQLIVEGHTAISTLDTVISKIKEDCKPFLKHKQLLYRGMEHLGKDNFGYKSVRKDRKPKDSSVPMAEFLDKFYNKHKIPLRSQSLFCLARDAVNVHGYSYYIFPIGKFKFAWFDEILDLYDADPNSSIYISDDDKDSFLKVLKTGPSDPDKMINMLIDTANDFSSALRVDVVTALESLRDSKPTRNKLPTNKSESEIIIDCKYYYFINVDEITNLQLMDLLF